MKIGLFIDTSSLYWAANHHHHRDVDYGALLDYLKGLGTVEVGYAYGLHTATQSKKRQADLKALGLQTKFKIAGSSKNRKTWDVSIAIDAISSESKYDTAVLCTCGGNLHPLIWYLREREKRVILMSFSASDKMKTAATSVIEIPESLLVKP